VILLLFVHYVAKFSPWWHSPCFSVGSHLVVWPTSPWSPDFGNFNFLLYKKCFSWLLWNHWINELIIMKVFSASPVEYSCVSWVVSFGYVRLTWLRVLNLSFYLMGGRLLAAHAAPQDTLLWQLVVPVSHWAATSIAFDFTDACEPTHPPHFLYAFSKREVALRDTVVIKLYSSSLLSFLSLFFSLTFFVTPLLSVYHLFGVSYVVWRSAWAALLLDV